jgi:GTP-binding protein
MAGSEGRDPYEDYVKINEELKLYNEKLAEKPQIVAANKMDLPQAEENLSRFVKKVGTDVKVYPISAATRQGINELVFAIAELLDTLPKQQHIEAKEVETTKLYKAVEEPEPFSVRKENEVFVVEGERIEKLVKMTNLNSYDAWQRFGRILRSMGVDDALRKKGAKDGDTVRIGEIEFEFVE